MQDPDVVEALANLPESKEVVPPPLEGYGPIVARLDHLIDRVTQLLYMTGHQDVGSAPETPRPQYPHEVKRRQLRKGRLRLLTKNFD